MADQIILQPNGKFCIFNTISDGISWYDVSREELIDMHLQQEKKRITQEINHVCDQLEAGKKPYHQFTMTWEEAVQSHKENFGEVIVLEDADGDNSE